ncbi:hypothetical protein [Brevibacillus porteri]|uniref:WD40 repeat domain-containing protein n=1 Tax=Brevibacillus porteri TaxID=2126350 RepID=A0ABX5FND3_9BACL|nr:hypothetical protein [Brevibacillus porteri]MED1800219.1 hypothetical protein [Brevibacillus porteri]MED2133617.1 hypothetical protein [Brevibacillus porteri]MED2747309.1 hypothetical protein [Brevibacillus porteri]MED2813174.1 hypothetical protein [Brevibacillus porteri]MED2892461.1 hypothetical protein [Brevibacillus porteri]
MNIANLLAAHGVGVGKYRKGTKLKRSEVTFQMVKSPEMQTDTTNSGDCWLVSDQKNKKTYIYEPTVIGLKKIDDATRSFEWTKAPGTERSPYNFDTARFGRNLEIDEDGNIYFVLVATSSSPYLAILRKMNPSGGVVWDLASTRSMNNTRVSLWRDPSTGYLWVAYDADSVTFDVFDKAGNKIRSINTGASREVYSFVVDESAQQIFIGSANGFIYVHSFTGSQLTNINTGYNAPVWGIQIDANYVFCGFSSHSYLYKCTRLGANGVAYILPQGEVASYLTWNKDKTTLYIFGLNNAMVLNSPANGYVSVINNASPISGGSNSRFGKFLKENEDFVFAGNRLMSWWEQSYTIK